MVRITQKLNLGLMISKINGYDTEFIAYQKIFLGVCLPTLTSVSGKLHIASDKTMMVHELLPSCEYDSSATSGVCFIVVPFIQRDFVYRLILG